MDFNCQNSSSSYVSSGILGVEVQQVLNLPSLKTLGLQNGPDCRKDFSSVKLSFPFKTMQIDHNIKSIYFPLRSPEIWVRQEKWRMQLATCPGLSWFLKEHYLIKCEMGRKHLLQMKKKGNLARQINGRNGERSKTKIKNISRLCNNYV
uniref:Uncharacterized protein n=1 Tax=Micrurus lemniscatus lemniscatus TaxID=129467 RepID=A0A2D4HB46_MICLE